MTKTRFENIINQISKVIIGKQDQVKLALTCLFAKGHLLIEDLPGIGKTTLAKVLSKSLGLHFRRIQCTNDMLPGDILGISIFEKKSGSFVFHPGPIFTQVLLTDEINRATPKTQSALLEAMEEEQVTTEGKTRPLDIPFFVIATQNPREQAGTFPLPESQLDRFLMRIDIGYPGRQAEKDLLKLGGVKKDLKEIQPMLSPNEILEIQKQVEQIHISDPMLDYIRDILDFTRTSSLFYMGLSPRAGIGILRAAKAWAFLHGRDYGIPEDIQKVILWITLHRLRSGDNMLEFSKEKLMAIFMGIPIP